MKKTTTTMTKDVWICETCGRGYTSEEYGKWVIYHCPEHGEFCNDLLKHCGLFRMINKKRVPCCPICGWATTENYAKEYDERKGKLPETKKEKESLKWEQCHILSNPVCYAGYKCYERLKKMEEGRG